MYNKYKYISIDFKLSVLGNLYTLYYSFYKLYFVSYNITQIQVKLKCLTYNTVIIVRCVMTGHVKRVRSFVSMCVMCVSVSRQEVSVVASSDHNRLFYNALDYIHYILSSGFVVLSFS